MQNCCTFVAVFAMSLIFGQNSAAQQIYGTNHYSQIHGSAFGIPGTPRKGIHPTGIAIALPKKTKPNAVSNQFMQLPQPVTAAVLPEHQFAKPTTLVPATTQEIQEITRPIPVETFGGSHARPQAGMPSKTPTDGHLATQTAPVEPPANVLPFEPFQSYPDFQAQGTSCLAGG